MRKILNITAALTLTFISTNAFADVKLNREPQQISFNEMITDNNNELKDIRAQFKASIEKSEQKEESDIEETPSIQDTAANE